ncbi:hypothetical protein VPMG_00048 [Vibrio phage VBP32]|uniref:Uncharacterized protein n=2 Tax=Stoningtonvirus VBP47 TaxID=2846606 RepID=M4T2P6_9CAUD|nr:hypothetical protein VPNG_00080 [Vibrio phage VBP47]YP_007676538.1 hypothetical protein VPMG_00048 [Vibrio phage VBP32]AGH57104.1 hypothetical protein VPNG_00080 [Vibrio phage VBP47]AGH57187.1 hypothetical protein VPMG_00048 [Vibrio phage VBP32]
MINMLELFPITYAMMLERRMAAAHAHQINIESFPFMLMLVQKSRLHRKQPTKTYI